MNYEFLKRLFTTCSDEGGDYYADGLNLCELYEQVEEVAAARKDWNESLNRAALPPAVADDLGVAAFMFANAYELQGFINGFRLCAQMKRELEEPTA